jgi:hypothetical protein
MKGIVLGLFGLLLVAVSAVRAGDNDFGLTNNPSLRRDPAAILRTAPKGSDSLVRLVTDDRTEARGTKPSVAFTVLRFTARSAEVSLQPIAGPINGAQLQLSF